MEITPIKLLLGVIILAVTAAVALGGVSQTGKAQKNVIQNTESKATELLN